MRRPPRSGASADTLYTPSPPDCRLGGAPHRCIRSTPVGTRTPLQRCLASMHLRRCAPTSRRAGATTLSFNAGYLLRADAPLGACALLCGDTFLFSDRWAWSVVGVCPGGYIGSLDPRRTCGHCLATPACHYSALRCQLHGGTMPHVGCERW
ncbi:hypothetical protein F5X68DRAFT_29288 [Plectosphaerella plurivora]|uniref:Uncharacterized protein n=1 Tax=Plectosphaerella plurivora TaxID=936078 RepID=A0A9P8VMB1_9PEZI|nr:hypothetical protein F5X68DRAFT_29288 [Plectosphaerella plurivora]